MIFNYYLPLRIACFIMVPILFVLFGACCFFYLFGLTTPLQWLYFGSFIGILLAVLPNSVYDRFI